MGRSSGRGRPAQAVVDCFADAGIRDGRHGDVGGDLVEFAQHGEEIGGGFAQVAFFRQVELGVRRVAALRNSVSSRTWPSLTTWKQHCWPPEVFLKSRKSLLVKKAGVLGALPVHFLPASQEILETLERWGIRDCAALAALPLLDLSERLGQAGVYLHELARGAYLRALTLAEPGNSFEEEMTLEDAVEELEPLAFILGRLLDQLCARLNARALAANSIRVRFELDAASQIERAEEQRRRHPFGPKARSKPQRQKESAKNGGSVRAAAANAKASSYEKALTLPLPMRDSKMLLKLLRLQLQGDPPDAPIQKVFLAAEPANPRATQGGLFLPSYPDPEKLELTIARLANLLGDSNIGSPEIIDTHRPGAFRIRRFVSASRYFRKSGARGKSPSGDRFPHFQARAARANRVAQQASRARFLSRPVGQRGGRLRAVAHFRRLVAGRRLETGGVGSGNYF